MFLQQYYNFSDTIRLICYFDIHLLTIYSPIDISLTYIFCRQYYVVIYASAHDPLYLLHYNASLMKQKRNYLMSTNSILSQCDNGWGLTADTHHLSCIVVCHCF